jgi:hypothetical protein
MASIFPTSQSRQAAAPKVRQIRYTVTGMAPGVILGNMAIWLAALNAVIQIADLLLSASAKARIVEALERAFVALDDITRKSTVREMAASPTRWRASAVIGWDLVCSGSACCGCFVPIYSQISRPAKP